MTPTDFDVEPGLGELVSLREAAKALGVRRETVGDLVRARAIPFHKHPSLPKAVFLDREAVARLRALLDPSEQGSAG